MAELGRGDTCVCTSSLSLPPPSLFLPLPLPLYRNSILAVNRLKKKKKKHTEEKETAVDDLLFETVWERSKEC